MEMKEMENNLNPPLLSTVLPAKRVSLNLLCHSRKTKRNSVSPSIEKQFCVMKDIMM